MLHNVAYLCIVCCNKLHVGDNVTKWVKMLHNAAKKFDWVVLTVWGNNISCDHLGNNIDQDMTNKLSLFGPVL